MNQLKVKMEGWSRITEEFGNYYIKINTANFLLELIEGGKVIRTHKVIGGKPTRSTPIFNSTMEELIFNPVWNCSSNHITRRHNTGCQKKFAVFKQNELGDLWFKREFD
jgi:murein L,D-transpeptidase YcbB/YkuD